MAVKAVYGSISGGSLGDNDQYAVSATYTADALSVTAFHNMALFSDDIANGVGVSYDLGGGAAVKAGLVNVDNGVDASETSYDAGVTFSF